MISNIKQFKLTNGSEIICEVVEWCEKGFHEIIIKNAMEIRHSFDSHENEYYYSISPWIHLQENEYAYTVVDSRHIISTSIPNHILIHQYKLATTDMHINANKKSEMFRQEQIENLKGLSETINAIKNNFEITDNECVKKEKEKEKTNIIKFPSDTDILH